MRAMADQETQKRDEAGSADTTSSSATTTESGTAAGGTDQTGEKSRGEQKDETDSKDSGSGGEGSGSAGEPPARRSEDHAKPQELSDEDREAQEANRNSFLGRRKKTGTDDTAEEPRRRSVNVSELAWRAGSILATGVRVLTLLFAVVLVAHIALVVVGVNPANGVASFLRGFADTVVLGFRDLFLPADPTIMLVVDYGVAAVFWVVVGGFLSAGIRFVAARLT